MPRGGARPGAGRKPKTVPGREAPPRQRRLKTDASLKTESNAPGNQKTTTQPRALRHVVFDARQAKGRPSAYLGETDNDRAHRLALLGLSEEQIAEGLGISEKTLQNWMVKKPAFGKAVRAGRLPADARMAQSLYHRGTGYSHDAVKIMQYEGEPIIVPYTEHYPPDTQAASLWLRNRQPRLWRDKQEIVLEGQDLAKMDDAGRIAWAQAAVQRLHRLLAEPAPLVIDQEPEEDEGR